MKKVFILFLLSYTFFSQAQTADEYFESGNSKLRLKDYYGAIADHTKAIEIRPNSAGAYYNRGLSKSSLEDHYGAIADYTKAIEIRPNDAGAYGNRGICKELIGDRSGACSDWRKSVKLGEEKIARLVSDYCN
jgi:tetratricopeptide (TPR) repeat protein